MTIRLIMTIRVSGCAGDVPCRDGGLAQANGGAVLLGAGEEDVPHQQPAPYPGAVWRGGADGRAGRGARNDFRPPGCHLSVAAFLPANGSPIQIMAP